MVKAIILDVDGTLLAKDQCLIEKSTVDAINIAKEKGIKIIVATGRGYSFIQQDVKDSIKPDLYVCCNGGAINDIDGKVIKQYPLKTDTIERFVNYCQQNDFAYGFKCANDFIVYNDYPYFVKHYCTKAILQENVHDHSLDKTYSHDNPPVVGFVFFKKDIDTNAFAKEFSDMKFTFWSTSRTEGTRSDVNKAVSLKDALDIFGISFNETICFGDGNNDIEMLEKCGIAVAMGNSNDEVKSHADYICKSVNENGIYNALKKYEII